MARSLAVTIRGRPFQEGPKDSARALLRRKRNISNALGIETERTLFRILFWVRFSVKQQLKLSRTNWP